MKKLNLEEIMERLMRLHRSGTCIHMRDSFPPGPSRWYVSMGSVSRSSLTNGGYCPPGGDGSTPEEAAQNLWKEVVEAQDPDFMFIRYNCKPHENIPGDQPQVWVRWSVEKDDWQDVPPTEAGLARHGIGADRIRKYQEQKWMDRY